MPNINQCIEVFAEVGSFLAKIDEKNSAPNHHLSNTYWPKMQHAIGASKAANGWFTLENICLALRNWGGELTKANLNTWADKYDFSITKEPKNVALIMAGNIPLVGFHDFLSVLISGNKVQAKLSSDDRYLLPVIAEMLVELLPEWEGYIAFVDRVKRPDAVIATGSDNTARYFEHYFGKYPNIIRKNRTSIAVLSGNETTQQLQNLGKDFFTYFGLGCRNVSKIYVPIGYDLNNVFGAIVDFGEVGNNNKYANNYDYHRALFMLNKEPFLENNFAIFREHNALHTPISVIHYQRYADEAKLREELNKQKDQLQCIVGNGESDIAFGETQTPALWDYADNVDTLDFLTNL